MLTFGAGPLHFQRNFSISVHFPSVTPRSFRVVSFPRGISHLHPRTMAQSPSHGGGNKVLSVVTNNSASTSTATPHPWYERLSSPTKASGVQALLESPSGGFKAPKGYLRDGMPAYSDLPVLSVVTVCTCILPLIYIYIYVYKCMYVYLSPHLRIYLQDNRAEAVFYEKLNEEMKELLSFLVEKTDTWKVP